MAPFMSRNRILAGAWLLLGLISLLLASTGCGANGLADLLAALGVAAPGQDGNPDDNNQQTPDDQTPDGQNPDDQIPGGQSTPVVAPDLVFTTAEDTPLAGTLATGDVGGITFQVLASPLHGLIAILPNGDVTYTPTLNYAGTDSFTYQVTDGTTSATGTVSLTVTPVNDAPVAANDLATLTEDATVRTAAGNVLANDADFDIGDIKFVTQVKGDAANVGANVAGLYGTLLLNAAGTFTYTLDNTNSSVNALNVGGTLTDTIPYTMQDAAGATSTAAVVVTILGANDPPVTVQDTNQAVEDGGPVTGNVLANDSDPDSPTTTVEYVSGSKAYVGAPVSGAYGSVQIESDGAYAYRLDNASAIVQALAAGQTVTDLFTYASTDGTLTSAEALLLITVNGANDPPTAADDGPYYLTDGQTFEPPAGTLLSNDDDVDNGDTLTAVLDTPPTKATEFALNPNGSFRYVHDGSGAGSDSFTYHARDAAGADSNVVTVSLSIRIVAVANDDAYTAVRDVALVVSAAEGVIQGGSPGALPDTGDPAPALTHYGPIGGPLSTTPGTAYFTSAGGEVTMHEDGSFIYVPATGFSGEDAFEYEITNAANSDTATVTITVQRPPTARDDHPGSLYSIPVGGVLIRPAGDLFVDHGDGEDDLGLPAGTVIGFAGDANTLALNVSPDGGFSYSAVAPGEQTFTYTLGNAAGQSTATVTVLVTQAPTAASDPTGGIPADSTPPAGAHPHPYHVPINTPFTNPGGAEGLLTNDLLGFPTAELTSFGPATGLETTVASASDGTSEQGGVLRVLADGGFTYTPPANFTGLDTFKYALDNGYSAPVVATVTLAVGFRPVATDDFHAVTGNIAIDTATGVPFSTLGNDAGDQLVAALVSATNGTATVAADGTFTFNPNAGYTGPATITYSATNGFGSVQGTVNLTVSNLVWFVDNAQGINGDGRLSIPFNSLASAQAATPVGVTFLYHRGGDYAGGYTLDSGERLVGQGAAFSTANLGISLAAHSANLPMLSTPPTLTGTVALAANGTVRGLNITTIGMPSLSGTSLAGVAVDTVALSATGARALNLVGCSGIITLMSTSVTNSNVAGVLVDGNSASVNLGVFYVNNAASGQTALSATGNTGLLSSAAGTISTGSGRAIMIDGGAGYSPLAMSLTSISTSGANYGLTLNRTTGSFAVVGDGVNLALGGNSSGGTITGSTSNGVSLTDCGNVSLARMKIQNSTGHNLLCTANSGTRDLTLSYCTLANSIANGLNIDVPASASGSFGTVTVTGCQIQNHSGTGLRANIQGSGNISILEVTGNAFVGNPIGVDLATNGTAHLGYNIHDNPTMNGDRTQINIAANDTVHNNGIGPSMQGFITNNHVVLNPNVAGIAIWVVADGDGNIVTDINGNAVNGFGDSGIDVEARGGTGRVDATIRNNTVATTSTGAGVLAGVFLRSGNGTAGETSQLTVKLQSNNVSVGPAPFAIADYYLDRFNTPSTFRIDGLTPSPATLAQVEAYIIGTDLVPPATAVATAGASQYVNAAVQVPTLP